LKDTANCLSTRAIRFGPFSAVSGACSSWGGFALVVLVEGKGGERERRGIRLCRAAEKERSSSSSSRNTALPHRVKEKIAPPGLAGSAVHFLKERRTLQQCHSSQKGSVSNAKQTRGYCSDATTVKSLVVPRVRPRIRRPSEPVLENSPARTAQMTKIQGVSLCKCWQRSTDH
jgi:hypothetical protein